MLNQSQGILIWTLLSTVTQKSCHAFHPIHSFPSLSNPSTRTKPQHSTCHRPVCTSSSILYASSQPQQSYEAQEFRVEKKAGEEGYSILRRPLDWETESDPRFEAPQSLDESMDTPQKANADWFEDKIMGGQKTKGMQRDQDDHSFKNRQNGGIASRTMEFEQELDLRQRTLDTLDYPMVLQALLNECGTKPAQRIVQSSIIGPTPEKEAQKRKSTKQSKQKERDPIKEDRHVITMGLTAPNVEGVHNRYQAVKEMKYILSNNLQVPASRDFKDGSNNPKDTNRKKKRLSLPPLQNDFDLAPMFQKVDEGQVLDGPDILDTSIILEACIKVKDWCHDLEQIEIKRQQSEILGDEEAGRGSLSSQIPFVQVPRFGHSIHIDEELLRLLSNAFDDEGKLSGTSFPTIGRLRSKVRLLKRDILSTLDTLISSPSIKNKLSLESGGALFSEVNGRIVIPISDKYKNSVGIIHDASRSGKTSYVEPTEVVGPTNDMRQAEFELKKEEDRVWRMLTKSIIDKREEIKRSIAAVAQIDLILARIRLGDQLSGVIPEVKDEGVISLRNAKHPVLLLRQLDNVVGSDIDIGAGGNQGLVR